VNSIYNRAANYHETVTIFIQGIVMIYEKDITNTEQIGAYHFRDSRQFAICFDIIDGYLHKFTQLRTPPGSSPRPPSRLGMGNSLRIPLPSAPRPSCAHFYYTGLPNS